MAQVISSFAQIQRLPGYGNPPSIIAAYDSSASDKAQATLVVSESGGAAEIEALLESLGAGAELHFVRGTYNIGDFIDINNDRVTIDGGRGRFVKTAAEGQFRTVGTFPSSPRRHVIIRNMYWESTSSPKCVDMNDAVDCLVENIFCNYTGANEGGSSVVSAARLQFCTFRNIRLPNGPPLSAAMFCSRTYDCVFENLYCENGQEVLDLSGARRCIIRGIRGDGINEGLDLGNVSDCVFSDILFRDCEVGIGLKTEIIGSWPAEEGYGSNNNVFSNIRVIDFTESGIKLSGGAASAENQKVDHNAFYNCTLTSSSNTAPAVVIVNGDNASEPFNRGFKLANARIVSNNAGIRWTAMKDAQFDNVEIRCASNSVLSNAASNSTVTCDNNQWNNCRFITSSTTAVNVAFTHEVGLKLSNFTVEGGQMGVTLTSSVFCNVSTGQVKNVQQHGFWCRPCPVIDRRGAGDSVGLLFSNIIIENSNIENGFRYAMRFDVDGNVTDVITGITTVNVRIEDTQATPTARDFNYTATNAGTFDYLKRIGDSIYTNAAVATPSGANSVRIG